MRSPTGPAEARVSSWVPPKAEVRVGNPGLWAEDRGIAGRPLMEAHYLKTVWQDCPADKIPVVEYSRNAL